METVALLQMLCEAFGVAGFEEEVRERVRALVEPLADEVRVDRLGNLLVTRRGRGGFTLMLDAHLDEIGLIVNHIEPEGFLRFAAVGGWDARILPALPVTVRTREGRRLRGVIGTLPTHVTRPAEREKPIPLEDLFIDVGARSAEEAAAWGLRVGDPAVPAVGFERLADDWLLGKALDDRVGCAVLVRVLEALRGADLDLTLVCCFAVGEETGLRGARTAAYAVNPDLALAVEGTVAADLPGVPAPRQPAAVGRGPALTLADTSIIVHPRVVQALERIAAEAGIPFQYKRPLYGATDAGAIHVTREGVLAGVVAVPCRYIHTPASLMRLADFEATARFVEAVVRRARAAFA
ncbi:MAG TPA: M42 family metallopeptidase [bacterium]|nr:M42 family metallopeptidase [bacterium]